MLVSDLEFLAERIQSGSVCVIPTDTIYGLVATVQDPETVEKVYEIKGRLGNKPFIILISEIAQLEQLSIKINELQLSRLEELWPGPVSVILACEDEAYNYLHRGKKSLAVRMPDRVWLRELIHKTGPIIATSANKSGQPVSSDINQIMRLLPEADLYIEGLVGLHSSNLVVLSVNGEIEYLNRKS